MIFKTLRSYFLPGCKPARRIHDFESLREAAINAGKAADKVADTVSKLDSIPGFRDAYFRAMRRPKDGYSVLWETAIWNQYDSGRDLPFVERIEL